MSDAETIAVQRTLPDGQPGSGAAETGGKAAGNTKRKTKKRVSSFWVKQLHTWHWMSSAICLIGMLLFAITGITLNHAGAIEASPQIVTVEQILPASLLQELEGVTGDENTPLPASLTDWANDKLDVNLTGRPVEWSDQEAYIALPKPGGDGWVSFDRTSGAVIYEATDRGWISWLNDLHKARDTGIAWSWFIDVFAAACIIFCLTGFFLLQLHSRNRPSTWPIVGAGLVLPLLLIILFMHR